MQISKHIFAITAAALLAAGAPAVARAAVSHPVRPAAPQLATVHPQHHPHPVRKAKLLPAWKKTVIGNPGLTGYWITVAQHLTGASGSDWHSGLAIIADHESSDNSLVAPDQSGYYCDSNCAAGTPSEGIAQAIQYTFDTYHQHGTGWNMLNPVADLAASINYIRARYGTIDNVPGVASVRAGGSYVGY